MRHRRGLSSTLVPLLRRPTPRIGESNTVSFRLVIISLLLLTIGVAHWLTPTDQLFFHAVHVAMRKMFILPIVLAAVWFDLKGGLVTAAVVTAVYISHVLTQWTGRPAENINQAGELATIWIVASLCGWLVGREKSVLEQLVESHRGTMHALIAALDAREHDTELHSLRVRAYAVRIGRELGMPEPQLAALAQGALLHDIGKIGVPDRILLKPGPLDEQEWRAMRKHPEIGQRMLESVPFLEKAVEVIGAHHERYDGTGYPNRLRNGEIPLNARIFAVADALDAITSGRPYKAALPLEEARRRIEQDGGAHFDPAVVNAFLQVPVDEWRQIAHRSSDPPQGAIDPVNLLQ
jgi:putative nucleotidyltransferase with HDIG domain